ncbi:phospho-N-acetylmuramoyl-pentapeptide-transferase [Candidatus Hydrogenosomobacter endosymbioticus]|uniref:Phospho-N-acetylmuramoyl-pentapeptide-transferase n=2 Tax=Candidatus Hydrogenosomobacter endosymbioticus TaxID=2558174 RepID=A0ABM7V951_9PROT|nr:phospho-N-acetylmuramoyl-pentapeptide-transferase [Candidatus Hydrogenosomobacter endosymbioticus]
MQKLQKAGQPIRSDGPEQHVFKKGTPTMGGLLIITSLLVSVFLWADISNQYIIIACCVIIGFGAIGAVDDFSKLRKSNSNGLSAKNKLVSQIIVAILVVLCVYMIQPIGLRSSILFPLFKHAAFDIGALYVAFAAFVIVGSSNAVNLTDGLDGLAVGPTMISFSALGVIAYVSGHAIFANYLKIPVIQHAGELSVLCCATVGACLGFLWYNAHPARIFMGDVGSLSLGGLLGFIGVALKQEILLAIMGGVFVAEALSVVIQVASFKSTGKRVFLMAPIHHHFEKKGWSESTVVARFWIISAILAAAAMAALKLR